MGTMTTDHTELPSSTVPAAVPATGGDAPEPTNAVANECFPEFASTVDGVGC
jgi:hypothetical protein